MNVTGNVMNTDHFVDFYYLEALRANITLAKNANPEFQFRKSVLKLEEDVEKAFNHLSKTMALRIWVYLWGAALGEAEYAEETCPNVIRETIHMSYRDTFDYFPTETNVEMLKEVFDQDEWNSGFGGQAWLGIVKGMELYGKVPDAAFVDHAADLEHNGGCVFDKTGCSPFNLDCNANELGLHGFLDFKFSQNILKDTYRYNLPLSWKVYNLVMRYSNIIETVTANIESKLEWLTEFSIEWNEGAFENEFSWGEGGIRCEACGEICNPDEVYYVNDENLCPHCVETCEHCGEVAYKNDTQYIDGEKETWCDDCANNHKVTCEECGTDYHMENTNTTDDDETLCNDCYKNALCEICDEHYYHMQEHDAENHPTETQDNPLQMELPDFPPAIRTEKVTETVTLKDLKPVEMDVYKLSNSPLKVLNYKTYMSKQGKVTNITWIIMVPFDGFWMMVFNNPTLQDAIKTARTITPMVEWENLNSIYDWTQLPKHKQEAVYKAIGG